MPATESQPSFLGRISIRRNQVTSMDGSHEQELQDLEHFQRNVADRFADLLSPPPEDATPSDPLLSISWLRKLLDVFLCCEAEFKAVLIMGRDPCQFSKPPLDKLITDLLERTVKVLDICNAVSSGVDLVRQYQKLGEIVVSAFEQRPIGDGQVKRARKALSCLLSTMSGDDKENSHCKTAERSWSFNKGGGNSSAGKDRAAVRSLSMIVARNWSSSKQIHAMCSNLVAPRGGESTVLALPLYLMGVVMVFVMWVLVAAIPCQERNGLSMHVQLPRNLGCVQSIITMHEKIAEEWKKKEKKGSAGLLEEIQRMEKLGQSLTDFADSFQYPAEKEKEEEVIRQAVELAEICRRMDEGLVPLQQQIRELFHRVVRSRSEVFEMLEHASKLSQPTM